MSDRPVFLYAATYASYDDCLADYELLLEAHAAKLVGTYDVALIRKDNEGKIHVEKHEKPTQHGAWGGIAVGALVGVLFAPLVLGAAAIGGLAGGIGGHLKKGMSRDDAEELGDLLEDGQSALVVIGESRVEEQLDKALTRAEKSIEKEIAANAKRLKRELNEAQLPTETPFHTDSPEYAPTHRNVYHDNALCEYGKEIKQEHRISGSGGRARCARCNSLANQDRS